MQLTKFDQWLKERFIYETRIFTMRLPEDGLPRGVSVKPTDKTSKGAYRHELSIKSRKKADEVIVLLKENHLMYATHVIEIKHWYNSMIAPEGLSFTYRWILRAIGLVTVVTFAWGVYLLLQNAGLVQTLKETLKDFQ